MIIYGQGVKELKTVQSKHTKCSNCGEVGTLYFETFSKHAHIFWIPLFPIGKLGISECQHCKQSFEYKEMPDELRREYAIVKRDIRTPIWQFSGLVIIALLIAWGIFTNKRDIEQNLNYIANPTIGDVYIFRTENKQFSTFKLAGVDKDSVSFYYNEYEINIKSGINDINIPQNYSIEQYIVAISDLKAMFDKGDIQDVIRE